MDEAPSPRTLTADAIGRPATITPTVLFVAFMQMGLSGFGGVLPWARRVLVEQRHWLTEQEFAEVLSLCQFLPGPNIVNVSIYVGARFCGWRGSLAAVGGLMLAPCALVVAVGALYSGFAELGAVQAMIAAVASAAAGLVVATGLKMVRPVLSRPESVVFTLLAFVAVGPLRLPLVPVLLVLTPASILVAALAARRRR
jgi:chromate transporter